MSGDAIRESDLYAPVRTYLIERGYRVNGEVKECDIAATRDDELVVVEMKKAFNATLLIQATERQRFADSVYVAIPAPASLRRTRNWNGMCRLLRRLELGLILVYFRKGDPRTEVIFHPEPYVRKKRPYKRRTIDREIEGRTGDYNLGGSTRSKVITAYRESCIFVACCLERFGPMSPSALKKIGTGGKTQNILSKNFYGWFKHVSYGLYSLRPEGKDAFAKYPEIAGHYFKLLESVQIDEKKEHLAG